MRSEGGGDEVDFQGKARFDRRAVRVDDAQRLLLEAVRPLAAESVPLWSCGGRYPAGSAYATADWPPFDRSGLDGYAVRAADIAQATPERPVPLRVVDAIAAGQVSAAIVEPGTAVRIMTGAAVPEGADAVVMLEQTADAPAAGPGDRAAVLVKQPVAPGRNIAPRGEEFRSGSEVARPGERLRPGHIALLGTFGYAELSVVRRPRVAIFATGTELLPIEAPLEPGRIRDSNSSMVAALVADAGCEPLPYGRLTDDPEMIRSALSAAFREADAVVTTGGVSVGDCDIMAVLLRRFKNASGSGGEADEFRRGAATAASVNVGSNGTASPSAGTAGESDWYGAPQAGGEWSGSLLFDKVAMRPGSPTSAALVNGKPLFALSGNPGACYVGFELFVRPALLHMQGSSDPLPRTVTAELAAAVTKGSPHERFVRAKLFERGGRLYGDPLAFGQSSMMASLPGANALLRIPAGREGAEAGTLVQTIVLP